MLYIMIQMATQWVIYNALDKLSPMFKNCLLQVTRKVGKQVGYFQAYILIFFYTAMIIYTEEVKCRTVLCLKKLLS